VIVTARHRGKVERALKVWIASIEETKLERRKKKEDRCRAREVIEIVGLLPRGRLLLSWRRAGSGHVRQRGKKGKGCSACALCHVRDKTLTAAVPIEKSS
jgi:hypothetical protein